MSKKTLRKGYKKNSEVVLDLVSKQMSIYNYYEIDCNSFEKRFWEQNEFNIRLELELKATRTQFKDISDYFKKKSHKREWLEMVINRFIIAKTKTNIIFQLIEILLDISWYFVHSLFSSANISQLTLNIEKKIVVDMCTIVSSRLSQTTKKTSKKK